jgi:hypothetical protein
LIELERIFILPLAPRWVRHSYLSKRLHTIPYTCGTSHPFRGLRLKPPDQIIPTVSSTTTILEARTTQVVTATLPTPTPVTKEVVATPVATWTLLQGVSPQEANCPEPQRSATQSGSRPWTPW